ncbi:MAG: hypothetical protein R3F11_01415 [Verrucomicrobiales bacterium]
MPERSRWPGAPATPPPDNAPAAAAGPPRQGRRNVRLRRPSGPVRIHPAIPVAALASGSLATGSLATGYAPRPSGAMPARRVAAGDHSETL